MRTEHALIPIGIEKKPIIIISISIITAIQLIIFVLEMLFICLFFLRKVETASFNQVCYFDEIYMQ